MATRKSAPVEPIKTYRIVDKRHSAYPAIGASNRLFEAARPSATRKGISYFNRDIHRNLSQLGREEMMSAGRYLFANNPIVRGMLLEQANLAVGTFIPQFYGEDKAWGNIAEEWLFNWHNICVWQGGNQDYYTWIEQLVLAEGRDGDVFTVLVQGKEGYPFIQVIPAHRVYSNEPKVVGGPLDGSSLIDGAIIDEYGRVIAWRVYTEDVTSTNFLDIDADRMKSAFTPVWPDQLRGISTLAQATHEWQHAKEAKQNELTAQNVFSRLTLLETNETGTADELQSLIRTAATADDTTKARTAFATEQIDAGTVRYFRAGSGSTVQAFQHDRPGSNAQVFLDSCVRDAMAGSEWSAFFSLDPKQVGGAQIRVIVEKINRTIRKRQKMVERLCRWVDGYAIAKAMNLGLLPASDEWYKWEYQGPAEITADKKYDSDVDVQELNADITTEKRASGKRGEYWEDIQDQRLREKFRKIKRAKEIAPEYGLTPEEGVAAAQTAANPTQPNRTRREPNIPTETREEREQREE